MKYKDAARTRCFIRIAPISSVLAALILMQCASAAGSRCVERFPAAATMIDRQWNQHGGTSLRISLPPAGHRDLLIALSQRGVNVDLQALDSFGTVILQAANPLDREGTLYAYRAASASDPVSVVVSAREPQSFSGSIHLRVMAIARNSPHRADSDTCERVLRSLAAAGDAYQMGRSIVINGNQAGHEAARDPGAARAAFQSAVQKYQDALDVLSTSRNNADAGDMQLSIAALDYYELQDWSGSATLAALAESTFAATGDAYLRARAQAIQAAAWMEIATRSASNTQLPSAPPDSHQRLEQARTLLRQLADYHRAHAQTYDEALQINNIAVAYIYEASFEEAIPHLMKARQTFELLGDDSRAALALQNQAICEWGLGRLSAALPQFDRALSLMKPGLYPDLYLLTLNNSGLAHYAAGRLDESLRLQTRALDFAVASQADRARARSYYGMGLAYYAIGDRRLAEDFLRSALRICTAELDARIRVATLRALAVIEHETGRIPEAIAHNSEALRLATAPSARARILLRLAQDHAAMGEHSMALQQLSDLVARPPNGDRLIQAIARAQRGAVRHATGDNRAAEADLTASVPALQRFDAVADHFEAEVELARVYADQGRSTQALATIGKALRLSPEILTETSNPEYRASIVQALRPATEFELELLRARYDQQRQSGHEEAARRIALTALEAADEPRALVFENWRARHLVPGSDPQISRLLADSERLYHDMAERRFQLATREDRAGADDPRARLLREDLARLRVRLGLINSELATRSVPTGAGSAGQLRGGPVEAARRPSVVPDQAIIEFWIGSNHAYAWTITHTDVQWHELAPPHQISESARSLHQMMQASDHNPASKRIALCAELYALLQPALATAQHATDLIIIPDGALHYIPFAALRDNVRSNNPYLIQRTVISIAPALRLATSFAQPSLPADLKATPQRMLLVADPVYEADDPRLASLMPVSRAAHSAPPVIARGLRGPLDTAALTRLPSSAREAEQIRVQYGAANVDVLEGLDATRTNLLAKHLADYRFIHIASHGIMDAEIPQLSALILGKFARRGPEPDPYVRAGDLLDRTFNAQAVVLSACDTALGKEYASEGLVGLRYAALARGAHAVVASLWPVSDGIAADLMTYMYKQIGAGESTQTNAPTGGQSATVAQALASAMRHMLDRSPSLDPALWAPFSVYVAGDRGHRCSSINNKRMCT